MVARRLRPRVVGGLLVQPDHSGAPLPVDEPSWFAWLEGNGSFEYADAHGSFVAHKERSRGGVYWRAVRRQAGTRQRVSLGPSRALTLERLTATARRLTGDQVGHGAPATAGFVMSPGGVPPARRGYVRRPRLFDRLQDDSAPVVLVVAPAGYGKTTLLAGWIAASGRRAGWLPLDPALNDPRRFWAMLLAELETIAPGATARASSLLGSLSAGAVAAPLTPLLPDLAARLAPAEWGRSAVLVLDDYHLIANGDLQQLVALLAERLPMGLRLVIASRQAPPMPIARLRTRGHLCEVGAADLAFTPAETLTFLRETMGLTLDAATATALTDRTEGWAAGLQIAALDLRAHATRGGVTGRVPGRRAITAFLLDEVIAQQPADVQRFVERTAVLGALCAPLCDAVLAGSGDAAPGGSAAMLARLEATGLFLAPLDDDGVWFRYHALFADAMLHRLRAVAPALEPDLRRRAAAWYEAGGRLDEAIEQALAGRDWARAARLIEVVADERWRRGEYGTLQRWLTALPPTAAHARPRLALTGAAIAYARRSYPQLPALVETLEASLAAAGPAERDAAVEARATVLRAMVASLRGETERARALAAAALATLPADDADWRAFLLLQATWLEHFSDDLATAMRHAAEGVALAGLAGNHLLLVLLGQQAHLLHDSGRLGAAEAHLARARATVARAGARDLPETAALDQVEALVGLARNDLATTARALAGRAVTSPTATLPLDAFWAGMIGARLLAAHGDLNGAYGALDDAERAYRQVAPRDGPRAGWAALVVPAWRARLDASRGDLAGVRAWATAASAADLTAAPLAFWAYGPIPTMLARARLLTGDARGAAALLATLESRATAGAAGRALLEILVLKTLALEALARPAEATATLERALALAAPEGATRVFLDEGPALVPPLRRVVARGSLAAPGAQTALAALDTTTRSVTSPSPTAGPEPLTARERDVLTLTASGLSNAAIAGQLCLSVGTVKWHLRSIYGKLGAARRTDAVARARAAGLLN